MSNSPITAFYDNKVIFLTGCTGFLGTIVVEKLLRALPNLKRIILLIRSSRKMSVEDRINDYRNNLAFSRIDPEHFSTKIIFVVGDMAAENLGLSDENTTMIIEYVNVVFHCAATVKFNEPLKVALTINLKGTHELLKIARQMKKLQSFMYVSTCYSNCNRQVVEEKLYENKFSPKDLLLLLKVFNDDTFNAISHVLLEDRLNTYTFSKHVSEILVSSYEESLPIGIFRPDAIIASYKEPFPSWITNNGPNFIPISVITGVLKVLHASPSNDMGMVPVDMTANALLAAAFEVSGNNRPNAMFYNYSSTHNSIILKDYIKLSLQNIRDCHIKDSNGYASCLCIKSKPLYDFLKIFLHIIPAYFMDFHLKMIGRQQRFKNLYNKLHKQILLVKPFFYNHNWIFVQGNVDKLWNKLTKEDQDLLNFDLRSINWKECLCTAPFGIKQFLLKQPLTQSERGKYNSLVKN